LNLPTAEADSMLGNLQQMRRLYVNMHKILPANDIPYPFAFHPAPIGFSIPQNQQKIDWVIPANVSMPKNKTDLAFYSIPQLASLIKNKKISSVELTTFF
jgi:hypothetical protein